MTVNYVKKSKVGEMPDNSIKIQIPEKFIRCRRLWKQEFRCLEIGEFKAYQIYLANGRNKNRKKKNNIFNNWQTSWMSFAGSIWNFIR